MNARVSGAKVLFALAMLLGTVGQASAATIYDTYPSWDGNSAFAPFGETAAGAASTYGQTFIAPAVDNVLQNFSFSLALLENTHLQFKAYVYGWTGDLFDLKGSASLPAVYQSGTVTLDGIKGDVNGDIFQKLTFNTGGVALVPGGQYVAFLTVSDPFDTVNFDATKGISGAAAAGNNTNNGGGNFVFAFNGSNFGDLLAKNWDDNAFPLPGENLAWRAEFNNGEAPVPEPASMTLLGLGIAGMAGYRLRRRSQNAA